MNNYYNIIENYIVAYRANNSYTPTSIFINGDVIDPTFPIYDEWDAINMVLTYCNPADEEVVAKKTILDYDAYQEDVENITLGMLEFLNES